MSDGWRLAWCLWMAALALANRDASSDDVRGIPLKPDPPFAIDGDLADWSSVPNEMALAQPEQVVWGRPAWKSPEDLSGVARIAWRPEQLLIAVEVTDDTLSQTQHGDGIWKGDHVELYLDVRPDLEPERDVFGGGQFQLAFSPGNFRQTGDPLTDCKPEAFCYRPVGHSVQGIDVASARTASGWTLEAAIPWRLLGVQAQSGMPLRFEIGLSDTDSPEPQQESLMTISTAAWGHARARLMPAALAGTDGLAAPIAAQTTVFDEVKLERGGKQSFAFSLAAIPDGRDAVLSLDARLETAKVAGYTQALRLSVNGQVIEARRLINKPLRAKSRGGQVYSLAAGERFSTYYAPDFTSADNDAHYGLLDGVKACAFAFRVTDLVRQGENALVVENAADAAVDNPMIAGNGRIAFQAPPPPPKEKAGPPAGRLERIEPRAKLETAYSVKELPDAGLEITVGDESLVVTSQFSTPAPGWVHGSCPYFRHERRIEQKPEAVVVRDTFTNLTAENLPVMHRHAIMAERGVPLRRTPRSPKDERLVRRWLAGLEQSGPSGSTSDPGNPTSYAATARHGVGFAPLDDVFRVHVANYAVPSGLGLADNNLVVPPNGAYTAEWAVVPTDAPDYWTFINAVRRLVDANFRIDGCFAFLRTAPETDAWSDAQLTDFLRFKDAHYACDSIAYPLYEGHYTHGTSFQRVPHDNARAAYERWRRLAPGTQCLDYFHCFIDVTEDGPARFPDARVLAPDGGHATYGESFYRIYFPTETNSYGSEIAKNIDIILDQMKADGVYWDEHEYSRWMYHYGEPWDRCSGDIDAETMKLRRLKSSVTLLTEPWRLAEAKRILARGPLIGNGAPYTRAMAALKFPCFVETGSITHCTLAHLYSPIALGDHLTERSELDAYGTMLAALDYGCVYHWYNDLTVIPTHPHLTHYMYPITPVELHEGYIIGRERIITKKSGLYGWGDASNHEVHVFDDAGCEVKDFPSPLVRQDGKTYTELRIGEGWSAAIVRVE